ncbi:MAG: MlaD family protein [Verrucomicrobiota bacterium]
MKQKNTSDYAIAIVVMICSTILLGALTMALTGFSFGMFGRNIRIDFPSVAGIRVNSEVRYAGKPIGIVKSIDFLKPEERRQSPDNILRVVAQLDKDAPTLYKGTTAAIISDTILAEKFIDLIPLRIAPDRADTLAKIESGDVIQGAKVVGFDELTRSGNQIVTSVNDIITDLRRDYPDLHLRIGSLIEHTESLARQADSVLTRLNTMLDKYDPNLEKTVADLRVITQNLKVTTTYTKALAHTLGEKPWRLVWGGDTTPLPSEQEILRSDKPILLDLRQEENEENSKPEKAPKKSFQAR